MDTTLWKGGSLAGRICLVAIFFVSGISKITGWSETSGYMQAKGLPIVPVLLALAIAVELGGAAAVALGLRARWGALLLAAYLVPVTLVFHGTPDQRIQLLKNLALFGGLLMVAAFGPGPISLDARRKSEEVPLREPSPPVAVGR